MHNAQSSSSLAPSLINSAAASQISLAEIRPKDDPLVDGVLMVIVPDADSLAASKSGASASPKPSNGKNGTSDDKSNHAA
eukprot:jgi/Hompol1/6264/HPOL_000315-RA